MLIFIHCYVTIYYTSVETDFLFYLCSQWIALSVLAACFICSILFEFFSMGRYRYDNMYKSKAMPIMEQLVVCSRVISWHVKTVFLHQ